MNLDLAIADLEKCDKLGCFDLQQTNMEQSVIDR
jgi:hypothetical protein